MKATIEVKNRAEGNAIGRGISDPVTRATAIVVGVLLDLTPDQGSRVMRNVSEAIADAVADAKGGAK